MNVSGELAGHWRRSVVLKRDLFSTVERGRFLTDGGEVEAVLRRIDEVPWWTAGLAIHFLGRERKALAAAGSLGSPLRCCSPAAASWCGDGSTESRCIS